jgi:hypothetical protein
MDVDHLEKIFFDEFKGVVFDCIWLMMVVMFLMITTIVKNISQSNYNINDIV